MKVLAQARPKAEEVSWPLFARWHQNRCRAKLGRVCTHIRSDEHPLRECILRKVLVEQDKVLDFRQTFRYFCHRVITYEGAIFAISMVNAMRGDI